MDAMSTAALSRRLAAAHPQWSLGLMLLALHAAVAWGIEEWWSRAFLLAHFGLFLIWQPLWRGSRDIEPRYAFLLVIVGFLFAAWNNWWLTAAWVAVLFGLIGGSVPGVSGRRQRFAALLAALYLLSMLLIWVVPHLFAGQAFEAALVLLTQLGLPLLPLAILLIRVEPERASAPLAVDLFYSMLLFLLVVALVLGSFVVKQMGHGNYPLALAQTLFAIALLLMALSWLWDPHGGFLGLGHLFSRYLMSLGLPFERWVQRLAELAEEESEPQRFLAAALRHMLELPWVTGVVWRSRLGEGEAGARSLHSAGFSFRDLELRIYTRWMPSPALLLHMKLLTQMVGHFHDAKRREQAQRQGAYVQAIYETGARLTHDVKNLLQSLRSLCAAAESSSPEQAPALQLLMQRQLPQLTQRLNAALDKLRAPQAADATLARAAIWWQGLLQRHGGRAIEFRLDGPAEELRIPAELFDTVADNLIENALNKASEGALKVRVAFSAADGGALTVCDSGGAIPQRVAGQLFEAPVPSRSGLGVGLYQCARQAAQLGYRLALAANEPGRVCFELRREAGTG
ncbi:MAG TPA: HAMP domain-containing sensor histidine kinase [Burkholderiales bacterium]|nr:HAMP domain-containing sensor histidine kinase [Burkholderiales bacterium]